MNYIKKFNLKKKTIFVLGGSGLIGSEICKAVAQLDSKVINIDKVNKNKDSNYKNDIFFYKMDVSNTNQIEKNYSKLIKKYGTPDVFINSSYPKTKDWNNNSFKSIKPSLLTFKYVTLKPFSDKCLQDSRTHLCSVTQVII